MVKEARGVMGPEMDTSWRWQWLGSDGVRYRALVMNVVRLTDMEVVVEKDAVTVGRDAWTSPGI